MLTRSTGVGQGSKLAGIYSFKNITAGIITRTNFLNTLGPSGSCVRTEAAYYINTSGNPASAAANAERYITLNGFNGVLVEPTSTNICNNSNKPETSGWTKTRTTIASAAIAGPFPGTSGSKIQETSGTSGTHTINQIHTLADSTRYWISGYFFPAERTWVHFFHNDKAGLSHGGWVSLSGAGALGTTIGTPIDRKVELLSNGWYKVSFGIDSSTGAGSPNFSVNMSTANNIQIYTGDSSATFGLYVWGLQVEQSSGGPSTPVVTTATSGIRSQDQIKYTISLPATGYETLKVVTPWIGTDGQSHILFDSGKTLVSERLYVEKSADNLLRLRIYSATSGTYTDLYGTITSGNWASGSVHTVEFRWDPNYGMYLALDGNRFTSSSGSGTFTYPSGYGTSFYLGGDINGANALNGILYSSSLSSRASLAVTQPLSLYELGLIGDLYSLTVSGIAPTDSGSFTEAPSAKYYIRPLYAREGSNLIPTNTSVSGSTGYSLISGAVYASGTSHTSGTGSFDISQASPLARIELLSSNFVSVTSGDVVTFGYYLKTSDRSIVVSDFVGMYTSGSVFIANSSEGHRQTTLDPEVWYECASIVKVPSGVGKLKLIAGRLASNTSGGTVYIDDFYIFKGRGFQQERTDRTSFAGSGIRIDTLGNMDILSGGAWTPFFPFGIAQDQTLSSYTRYASAGFNTIMFGYVDSAQINKAKLAVDAVYAPSGMYSFQEVFEYLGTGGSRYGQLLGGATSLSGAVTTALAASAASNFLGYYFDNEAYADYDIPISGIGVIRAQDTNHPIFMNTGNPILSRMYGDNINWVGSYNANEFDYNFILDNLEGLKAPLGLACISLITSGGLFRKYVYKAIIQGNKGIFYWKDGGAEGDITTRAWWPEAPIVRSEVDTLLPIIRTPHWTTWTATLSDTESYSIRSSDYQRKGYVFLLNNSPISGAVTVTVSGLYYTPSGTTDAITGSGSVSVTSGAFTVPLSGYGTKVLRLD